MSFAVDLASKVTQYTDFSMYGKKLQIPYYLGGKNTPDEISNKLATRFSTNACSGFIHCLSGLGKIHKKKCYRCGHNGSYG